MHPTLTEALHSWLHCGADLDAGEALLRAHRQLGLTQASAMHALESLRADLPEEQEDRVLDLMDLAYGWCSASRRLWHHAVSITALEQELRRLCPGLQARQLVVPQTADDDGLWFYSAGGPEVQVESSSGDPPFLVEAEHAAPTCCASVSEALAVIGELLKMPATRPIHASA